MIEHRMIQANGIALHVAEAGPVDGRLVLLLHGFPEFWFGWRELIEPLAAAGLRVVAPDQRGYNLSSKPKGVDAYRLDLLATDIFALANAYGRDRFCVVGHDWGAAVAWWMATIGPERLARMSVINAPHPAIWRRAMTEDPIQRRKSRYVRGLRMPWLPELMMRMGNYKILADALAGSACPQAFDTATMAEYRKAWTQPGALTGGLNWYRALFRQDLPVPAPKSIKVPTLILWGDRDVYAGPELAEASAALCAKVTVTHLPDATHWAPHDEPDAVAAALRDFLAD